jgi:uncharacterized protein (DUF2236 family)
MNLNEARSVSQADLDKQLAIVEASAAGRSAGIFGPHSMMWRVNGEAAVFLGAGRALLLQLAHPWVATAIAQHSRSLTDPIGRFHRTFSLVFTLVFGTFDQAVDAARRLHGRHDAIAGTLTAPVGRFAAGSAYQANEVAALLWVHATLVETALIVHDLVLPPLTIAEREHYWREARLFAALFGIPGESLSIDWNGFIASIRAVEYSGTLAVCDAAREIAAALFSGAGTWLRAPSWYRALTASLLPDELRTGFGLAYGPKERLATERALKWIRQVYPRLPSLIRKVGPYQEAQHRLLHRGGPGPAIQLLNRFWIGHSRMGE